MPKYYLLGGENVHRRDAAEVNQQAFDSAGANPSVLVFAWARASFDRTFAKNKLLSDYFKSLGASTVNFVDYSSSLEEIKQKIMSANLVYLTGGLPSILIKRLKKIGVDSLLGQYNGVVVGRSAGALAVCRRCVITCRRDSEVKMIDGLGLVDLTLKAHYRLEKDEALKKLSLTDTIFALPKGSAIIYNSGKLKYIGKVFMFCNGERHLINHA